MYVFCSPIRAIYHNYHILNDLPPPPPDNKLWAVEFMKLLIKQISPAFCYFHLNANTILNTKYTNSLIVILIHFQQDAMLHSLFYLETALHVSGGNITHHQERKTSVSTASGICHAVIAICRYRGRVGTGLSVLWVAYATHSTLKPVPTLPR